MFKEVENAVIERVKSSSLGRLLRTVEGYGQVNSQAFLDFAVPMPAVLVTITDGKSRRVAMNKYAMESGIVVYVAAQHLGRQDLKRKDAGGAYELLQTVLEVLSGHDLGLDITPLEPTAFAGVFDSPELTKRGIALYMVRFETGWNIQKVEDGEAVYVDRVGIDYFLTPGDDVADAEDELTLQPKEEA